MCSHCFTSQTRFSACRDNASVHITMQRSPPYTCTSCCICVLCCNVIQTPEAVWLFNEVNEQPCLAPVFSRINAARLLAALELAREDMRHLSFTIQRGCSCSFQPSKPSLNKVSSIVLHATVKPLYGELKTMYRFPAEGEFCHLDANHSEVSSPSRLDPEYSYDHPFLSLTRMFRCSDS